MAISLDGVTQWVRIGSAGSPTDIYRTRPFTVAALVNSDAIDSYVRVIVDHDLQHSWSLLSYGGSLAFYRNGSVYIASSATITYNTGWYLVAGVMRSSGGVTALDFYSYRYNTSTLSVSGSGSSPSDADPNAPSTESRIGATDYGGSDSNIWAGEIGWAGIWAGDLGDARSSSAPRIWELIVRGPWDLIDANCKLFVPMLRNNLIDHSPNRYSLTNVGGAGFVGGGPTELPLSGVMFPIVTDGVAATTLSAGANTATVTNPTTSFSLALALSGGANTITATAPTTGFTLGGLTLAGGANTITATAPTSTLAAVLALSGGTQFITATAPTGTFNLGGLTLAAGAVVSTVSNATASLDSGLFFNAGTQTVTVTCPAGTFVLGGLSLAAGAQTATVTNANAVVAAALGLQQSGQSLLMVAPSVNMVVGSLTLTAGGLEITVVAPSALVSAGGVITTSTGLAIRLVPADRFDQGPVKGYYIA